MFGGRIGADSRFRGLSQWLRRSRWRILSVVAAVVLLVTFGGNLLTFCGLWIVSAEVYRHGKVADGLQEESAQILSYASTQQIACFLSFGPERIRGTACLVFTRPEMFSPNSDWRGIAPALATLAADDPSADVRRMAIAALTQIPVQAEDVDVLVQVLNALPASPLPSAERLEQILLAVLMERDPKTTRELRRYVVKLTQSSNPHHRNRGVVTLARYFPDAPELGSAFEEIAGEDFRTRWTLARAVRSAVAHQRHALGALLRGNAQQQSFALQVLCAQTMTEFDDNQNVELSAFLGAADEASAQLLSGEDWQARQIAIEFLARRGGVRLLLDSALQQSESGQAAVLNTLTSGRWADALAEQDIAEIVDHLESLTAILFAPDASASQRRAIAHFLTELIQTKHQTRSQILAAGHGLWGASHLQGFESLLAEEDLRLRQLGFLYFLRVAPAEHSPVEALVDAIEKTDPSDEWGRQTAQRLFLEQDRHPRLLQYALTVVDWNGSNQGFAARYLARHALAEMPLDKTVKLYRAADGATRSDLLATLLEHPQLSELNSQPDLLEELRAELFQQGSLLRLSQRQIANARVLLGAGTFDDDARVLFEQCLKAQARSETTKLQTLVRCLQTADLFQPIFAELMQIALSQPDPTLARLATPLLAEPGLSRGTLNELVEMALLYPDARVARSAISVISQREIDSSRIVSLLRDVAMDPPDSGTRIAAMTAWARIDPSDPELQRAVISFSNDNDYGVRMTALRLRKTLP